MIFLETQLLIAADLNYMDSENAIFNQLMKVGKLMSGFIHYLQTKPDVQN